MKLSKIFCFAICVLLVFSMFSGCNQPESEEMTTKTEDNTTNKEDDVTKKEESVTEVKDDPGNMEKTLEISWVGLEGQEIEDGNLVQKRIEEKFNVILMNRKISVHDREQANLMVSSGEMPDAGFLYQNPAEMYDDGVTRTIPKSFIEMYTHNYKTMLDENPIGWKLHLKQGTDDEYMALTGISVNLEALIVNSHYRLDWLEELDIVPEFDNLQQLDEEGRIFYTSESISVDELENILTQFAAYDPDGTGNTFAISGSNDFTYSWGSLMGMYGLARSYNVEYQGELYEWNMNPMFKDFVKLMSKWYDMGIIDPEFVTLSRAKHWEKITAGMVGWWTGPFNYTDDTRVVFQTRPPMSVLNNNPEAKLLLTSPEYGTTGIRGSRQWAPVGPLNYTFFIGNDVNDEKLIRILQIFDYINFDKEAMVWSRFGDEGVHFEWRGEAYKSQPVPKEGVKVGADTGFYFYNSAIYNDEYMPYMYGEMPNKICEFVMGEGKELVIRPYRWDYFNETNLSELNSKYNEDLEIIWKEFFYNAITGEIDIDSEWDNYVERWLGAGGRQILEEMEKAPLVEDMRKSIIQ